MIGLDLEQGWPNEAWVAKLRSTGWTHHPVDQFILKLSGRCNLACAYCYVYTGPDQSWAHRPSHMSSATLDKTIQRITEHCLDHDLRDISVVLHGGEPLILGAKALHNFLMAISNGLPTTIRPRFAVQTNATLINQDLLDVLRLHSVRVGVSLDGDAHSDRHRAFRGSDRPSFAATEAGLAQLRSAPYRHLFSGILAVIDPESDPVVVYEALLRYGPPTIDFLLPHANWSARPVHSYAPWLSAAFDRWYGTPQAETHVVLFEEIVNLLLGGSSRCEQVGLSATTFVIIDTDGSIQQTDALKTAWPGGPETGLNVLHDPIDAVFEHPMVVARQAGLAALADCCVDCELVHTCGGGHFAHRYRNQDGFRNPSVYCADLASFIRHVDGRLRSDLHQLSVR